ncbi:hypothetical protein ARMSODRAFT_637831 [Armillaria solidipes]|uniref:Uncharacterized protein n=1 Tax=Armillaria solidipes TaxID=1076256 RepID=A0A2H3BVA3_9AGAR|nr:hypothetical protein ARMSODRAFT_637831 [Armillaria solidipes]
MNASHLYRNPIATLAVAASAVKPALTLWNGGFDSMRPNQEPSPKHVYDYDEAKWIIVDSAKDLNAKKRKHFAILEPKDWITASRSHRKRRPWPSMADFRDDTVVV